MTETGSDKEEGTACGMEYEGALATLEGMFGQLWKRGTIVKALQRHDGDLESTAHFLLAHNDLQAETLIYQLRQEVQKKRSATPDIVEFETTQEECDSKQVSPTTDAASEEGALKLPPISYDELPPAMARSACRPWANAAEQGCETDVVTLADNNHATDYDDADDLLLRKVVAPRAEAAAADIQARPYRRLNFFSRATAPGGGKLANSDCKKEDSIGRQYAASRNPSFLPYPGSKRRPLGSYMLSDTIAETERSITETETTTDGNMARIAVCSNIEQRAATDGDMSIPDPGTEWEGLVTRSPWRYKDDLHLFVEDSFLDCLFTYVIDPIVVRTIHSERVLTEWLGRGFGRLVHWCFVEIPAALAYATFCALLAITISVSWPTFRVWDSFVLNADASGCRERVGFVAAVGFILLASPLFAFYFWLAWNANYFHQRKHKRQLQTARINQEAESHPQLMSLFVEDAFKEWVWGLAEKLALGIVALEDKFSQKLGRYLGACSCRLLVEMPLIVTLCVLWLLTGPFVALWLVFAALEDVFWNEEVSVCLDWIWKPIVFGVKLVLWLCLFPLVFIGLLAGGLRVYFVRRREYGEMLLRNSAQKPDIETGREEEDEPKLSEVVKVAFYDSSGDSFRSWLKGTRVVEEAFIRKLGCLFGAFLYLLLIEIPVLVAYLTCAVVLLPFALVWLIFKLWEDILLEPERPGCRTWVIRVLGFVALLLFNCLVVLPVGFLIHLGTYFFERRRNRREPRQAAVFEMPEMDIQTAWTVVG
ncbi:expressed unknown protein [Seminavis robusta]|uniref:Uncharacterized protein n=1 Tax=Seminavis robusta TaxID=568900 RepID=A0A9N8HL40_9STRA|nr:expressed unknown protein [Seminavis robusta]|eukprot:Sro885_g216100.1 n/a (764) ;mRNA; f:25904-28195